MLLSVFSLEMFSKFFVIDGTNSMSLSKICLWLYAAFDPL